MKPWSLSIALAACAGLIALGGCASPPPPAVPSTPLALFDDAAFPGPLLVIDAREVFALSAEMQHYLDVEIAPHLKREGRHRGLVSALYNKSQLRLDYDTEVTRNAAETFAVRSGNCLSLVVMSAALAKHLELPLYYQALLGQETWSRSGDLSLVNGHVNIVIDKRLVDRFDGIEQESRLQLSFGSLPAGRGSGLREVSEAMIVALFMNNRAAEALVRGELAEAYAYLREAVVQDPGYAGTYNTLAVIYQRRGLPGHAERAWLAALQREPEHLPALANFAQLLDAQGRSAEAAPLRERLATLEANPPFREFDLGRAAAQAGNFAAARDHIRREMRRDPEYHEFHFWLAVALYGLGETEQAREHLTTAMKNSHTRREQALYSAKLQRLTPTATSVQ